MRTVIVFVVVALAAAACGSGDDGDDAEEPTVALIPGDSAVGSVEIDGTTVDYVVTAPDGFEIGGDAPVVLALPPGGQDLSLTERLVTGTYEDEATRRGWVVVSPAAPNGHLWFEGSEGLIPGFLDWIETWVTPEGGRVHLVGVSNGGISAFRVAGQSPDRIASIVAFPGFPRSDEDKAALEDLTSIPVRLYAGENDRGWVEAMTDTAETLSELGGDVVFEIVPGEGHVISRLSDGIRIFDDLDAAR